MSPAGTRIPLVDNPDDPTTAIVKHLHECRAILSDPSLHEKLYRSLSANPSVRQEIANIGELVDRVASEAVEGDKDAGVKETSRYRQRVGIVACVACGITSLVLAAFANTGLRIADISAAFAFLTGFAAIAVGTSVIAASESTLETIRQYVANESS